MNATFEVYLWTPRSCPLGENGQVIAASATLAEVEELNERARDFGGHVQAFPTDGAGYYAGMAEDAGLVWKPIPRQD